MSDLDVRTTARLEYAGEGRDLSWRFFYQEDIVELRTQLQKAQEELLVAKRNAESWQEIADQAREETDCNGRSEQRCDKPRDPCLFHVGIFLARAKAERDHWEGIALSLSEAAVEADERAEDAESRLALEQASFRACDKFLVVATRRAESAEEHLRMIVSEAEGMPEEGLVRAIERAESAESKLERLQKAGVTDYSSIGCNRVDCHFCKSVWRPGEPPKHKKGCPLKFTQP